MSFAASSCIKLQRLTAKLPHTVLQLVLAVLTHFLQSVTGYFWQTWGPEDLLNIHSVTMLRAWRIQTRIGQRLAAELVRNGLFGGTLTCNQPFGKGCPRVQ